MRYVWAGLMLFFSVTLYSQPGTNIFREGIIHEIYIHTPLSNWFDTLTHDYLNHRDYPDSVPEIERPCDIIFNYADTLKGGFRFRGNFSYQSNTVRLKKPFKIVFDIPGSPKYDGLKSINLNNCVDDPSFLREVYGYYLMRRMGIPAPRTSFAKLFINQIPVGFYVLVEQVDNVFLDMHYGKVTKRGNLYKTGHEGSSMLRFLGYNDSVYIKQSGMDLKNNTGTGSWAQYIHLTDVLNNYKGKDALDTLKKIFDIDLYLTILAVEKLLYSWDSYWGNGNNFYLYEHPGGQIKWIPWDLNESMTRFDDIYQLIIPSYKYLIPFNIMNERPLLKYIFTHDEVKNRYLQIVCGVLDSLFTLEIADSFLSRQHAFIESAVYHDENKIYGNESFYGSLTDELIDNSYEFPKSGIRLRRHLPGLYTFIKTRRAWAYSEFPYHHFACTEKVIESRTYSLNIYPNPVQQNSVITFYGAERKGSQISIYIYDASGQEVYNIKSIYAPGNEFKIECPHLTHGVYFIKGIETDGSVARGKMVILP